MYDNIKVKFDWTNVWYQVYEPNSNSSHDFHNHSPGTSISNIFYLELKSQEIMTEFQENDGRGAVYSREEEYYEMDNTGRGLIGFVQSTTSFESFVRFKSRFFKTFKKYRQIFQNFPVSSKTSKLQRTSKTEAIDQ